MLPEPTVDVSRLLLRMPGFIHFCFLYVDSVLGATAVCRHQQNKFHDCFFIKKKSLLPKNPLQFNCLLNISLLAHQDNGGRLTSWKALQYTAYWLKAASLRRGKESPSPDIQFFSETHGKAGSKTVILALQGIVGTCLSG